MGVLTGRFPRRIEDSISEKAMNKLAELLKVFTKFAEGFGVAIAEREFEARLEKK